MRAEIGDKLIVEGDPARTGLVIGLRNDDGSPPYVVKWRADGHIALVYPGQYSRIVAARRHGKARQGCPGVSRAKTGR